MSTNNMKWPSQHRLSETGHIHSEENTLHVILSAAKNLRMGGCSVLGTEGVDSELLILGEAKNLRVVRMSITNCGLLKFQ
jgi:hypothetical protein